MKKIEKILNFNNNKIEWGMHNNEQIEKLVECLFRIINSDLDGDIVEFGCYVGESSKYLMKTLLETNSNKKLYVYDSFEGLPDLSKWEENSGWRPRTLKTTEDILIQNFEQNSLPIPIIHKDWFKDIPDYKIPEKICFAFLDGDFYDSIYDSLTKIYDKVVDGGVILFHDYLRPDLPGVDGAIRDFLSERKLEYNVIKICDQLGYMKKGFYNEIESNVQEVKQIKTTLVTGLWNINRDSLSEGWSRGYEHYLNKFEQLLRSDYNLIIFGDRELEEFVSSRRSKKNTQFVVRELSWFKNNEFYDIIQNIRLNPSWYNQVGWLTDSTQAKLDMYNPLVMSKVFLLHDAKILDKFNSEYLYWIDAGLTNTVHSGYFTHDNVIEKLGEHNFITFVSFPYKAETEIHGFNYEEMCSIVGEKIDKVCRGGFFGGPKNLISEFNSQYYSLMRETLSSGFMGTEESLFTILLYKYCETYRYFEIESNGLLSKFFEDVKNGTHKLLFQCPKTMKPKNEINVGLYVIGFNSPKQFETLIESMIQYDCNFIDKPQKFLLNNSTDESTFDKYEELCAKYEFVHIKKDNLGICGGRQFIAEHAETNNIDYYFFFEDDMFFYPKKGEVCRNGFNRFVDNFYNSILQIIQKHNFDFIKFNYSEFFGDNGVQWSWYNVPQVVREQFWPNNTQLPKHGLDQNAPRTNYENIRSHNGIPYVTGEVYYSNWPQVVSKEGNKKMFLDTTWVHPFEQTWMSHIFQETKAGNIKPALLLMTPTEHNRFDHYSRELRKES